MWKEEAASRGEEPYYNPEFLAVLYPSLKTPSLDTAISLLEAAPATYSVVEKCSPSGDSYEMNHFLERDPTVQLYNQTLSQRRSPRANLSASQPTKNSGHDYTS